MNVSQVDTTRTYVIKGTTLKDLLTRVECAATQFSVVATPGLRTYTLINAIPDLPGDGTFILGCVDGEVRWLATLACATP